MKLKSFFPTISAIAMIMGLFCGNNLFAQRYLTEKKPDLVLLAVTVKRESANQLNVIWSIQNQGDAAAQEVDKLLSFIIEGSKQPNSPTANHNWGANPNRFDLNLAKQELKQGEIIKGNTLIPYNEQDKLVTYRVVINTNDDFYEKKTDNNALVTPLVGK